MNVEVTKLIDLLPNRLVRLMASLDVDKVQELVLDLGREVEIRYPDRYEVLIGSEMSARELEDILSQLDAFGPDDRTGLDKTLHRISRINNKVGQCVGLTFRIGRDHPSNIELITDLLHTEQSILLLGPPSMGKTTMLRSTARYCSSHLGRRVVIVDTSNEIGGEGDIPHPAIGRARRMQVPRGQNQAEIMIRAVENHNPNLIIIDEIGTEAEVEAARTIAQRGVQLIATAHGRHINDLILNPPLSFLIGGVDKVTVSDDTMLRTGLRSKTKMEREMDPTFTVVVELLSFTHVAIHPDVKESVDCIVSEGSSQPEERRLLPDPEKPYNNKVHILCPARNVYGKVATITSDSVNKTDGGSGPKLKLGSSAITMDSKQQPVSSHATAPASGAGGNGSKKTPPASQSQRTRRGKARRTTQV